MPGFFQQFQNVVTNIAKMQNPSAYGALKVLHQPKDAVNPDKASDRIRNEIRAMKEITHRNLLPIIDVDQDSKWYVSPYYWKGTLATNAPKFVGKPDAALRALRPLVEAVAILHNKGVVHRDIKPQNIFLDSEDNLILGDFGLVFFSDQQRTRLSDTVENVGSRNWMPGWAYSMRVENVKPSFDVFSLGKVLWSMVSGKPVLPLWYFERQDFNLDLVFRAVPYIDLINPILKKCVVEHEHDCWQHAELLLKAIDKAIWIIETGSDVRPDKPRVCRVCSVGIYEIHADGGTTDVRNLGFDPTGNRGYKVFICNHCGHVQLFLTVGDTPYPAWRQPQS
jgi:serine/threonine protein kinase